MTSIYRAIFRNAMLAVWKIKYLWFFGIFAALVSNSGEFNIVLDNFPQVSDNVSTIESFKEVYHQGVFGNFWGNFQSLISSLDAAGWSIFGLLAILGCFIIWLAIVAQGSLFASGYKIYRKQKTDYSDALAIGKSKFWQVLWLNILSRLIIFVTWAILVLPFILVYMSSGSPMIRAIFVILSFIILLPLAIIVSFVIKYAIIYSVSSKIDPGKALRQAWALFVQNWLVSIEMAVLLFFINMGVVLAALLAAVLLAIPFALLMLLFLFLQMPGMVMSMVVLSSVALFVLVLWIGSMWTAFNHISWSFLFVRMSEGKIFSKLVRLVHKSDQQ